MGCAIYRIDEFTVKFVGDKHYKDIFKHSFKHFKNIDKSIFNSKCFLFNYHNFVIYWEKDHSNIFSYVFFHKIYKKNTYDYVLIFDLNNKSGLYKFEIKQNITHYWVDKINICYSELSSLKIYNFNLNNSLML